MRRLLGIALLGALLAPVPSRAQEDLTPDQLSAYSSLVRADQARDAGDRAMARSRYEEALRKYEAIARRNPAWHPELVQYRRAYCAGELERLDVAAADPSGLALPAPAPPEPPMEEIESPPGDAPPAAPSAEDIEGEAQDPCAALEAGLAEARARITDLEEAARAAAADMAARDKEHRLVAESAERNAAEVAALTGLVARLSAEAAALSTELAGARSAAASWEAQARGAGDDLAACRAERDVLAAQLAAATHAPAPAAAPDDVWVAQIAALGQELERTRERLAASEREARELLKELTFLKRRY